MPKPPRNQPPTEPSNLTFDSVSHSPTRHSEISAPSASSAAPRMPDTARESHAPWQIHPTQSSPTPPTPALPQGYKQTDVGIIPEDWEVVTVYDMAQVGTGSKNTQDRTSEGKYPFFVRSFTIERINTFSYDGEAVLTAGDGVGTGKVVHYINGRFDVHQRVYQISDFHANIKGYYFYLYFSMFFYARIMKMTAKSSVDSVRLEMITQMPIPLPPMEEQEAIAEALSDADVLVDALERLLWKKRRIKEGAMQELLTGRTRLPGFNGAWKTKRLGEICEQIVGGGTPSRVNRSFWGGNIPWATVKDFSNFNPRSTQEYITPLGLRMSSSTLVPAGDVIISTRMALAKVAIYQVDVSINQDLKALRLNKSADGTYIKSWFQHQENAFSDLGGGSTVKGLSMKDLQNFPILLPTRKEQEAIAEVLCGMDEEIEALEEKLAKARRVKQGMMQELLTGRIRLR